MQWKYVFILLYSPGTPMTVSLDPLVGPNPLVGSCGSRGWRNLFVKNLNPVSGRFFPFKQFFSSCTKGNLTSVLLRGAALKCDFVRYDRYCLKGFRILSVSIFKKCNLRKVKDTKTTSNSTYCAFQTASYLVMVTKVSAASIPSWF